MIKIRSGRVITVMERSRQASQHYRDDNNPNTIMRRFDEHGQITGHFRQTPLSFMDVPAVSQAFIDAREMTCQIEATFSQLPVQIRKRFDYKPELLLRAIEDPLQRPELEKLGILIPKSDSKLDPKPLAQS